MQATDAVEKSRGFAPPLFIDVRLRRKVRAAGFKDNAFAEVVGKGRYVWLPAMGNKNIDDESATRAMFAEPTKVSELLELVLDAHEQGRRVIFFCACEQPFDSAACHRMIVGDLLLKAAAVHRHDLTIQEWPGGDPVELEVQTSPELLKKLRGAAVSLALPERLTLAPVCGLPWYSLVTAHCQDEQARFLSGPAVARKDGWALPITHMHPEATPLRLRAYGAKQRKTQRLETRSSTSLPAWSKTRA